MGNGEAKELVCTTHGHELRGAGNDSGRGIKSRGEERGEKNGRTVVI